MHLIQSCKLPWDFEHSAKPGRAFIKHRSPNNQSCNNNDNTCHSSGPFPASSSGHSTGNGQEGISQRRWSGAGAAAQSGGHGAVTSDTEPGYDYSEHSYTDCCSVVKPKLLRRVLHRSEWRFGALRCAPLAPIRLRALRSGSTATPGSALRYAHSSLAVCFLFLTTSADQKPTLLLPIAVPTQSLKIRQPCLSLN